MRKNRLDEVYNISIVSRTDARKRPLSYVVKKKTIVGLITAGGALFVAILVVAVAAVLFNVDESGKINTLKQEVGQQGGKVIVAMATNAPVSAPVPSIQSLADQSMQVDENTDDSEDIYVSDNPPPLPTADSAIVQSSKDPAFIEAAKVQGVKRDGDILINGKIELVNWFKGGDELFSKGTKATVIDLMTGKHFNVYRFGGWYHADSEPMTKEDVAIYKDIYGGHWSWDRRPIVLVVGDRYIAASMHGMPHKANPNSSNGMPGHFCIHLFHSKVHETGREEAQHQACVMEAFRYGNLVLKDFLNNTMQQNNAASDTQDNQGITTMGTGASPVPQKQGGN